ncbi:MAG: ATP-binding cassette domain-containing protein [Alphaproteobacteria bacterium]|nr:ATP-binding cassette domain-containing protein [Alphaproteobacteria bacterium]
MLSDVSFEISSGPRTVILGPNGAGKSLTLRLAHGLLAPTQGEIRWRGGGAAETGQAMVFERPVLLRRSTRGNVEHALALSGVARSQRRARADAALVTAGLADLAGRPARVLSAGEQQRLALARAWALEPQILFLDETTASLDPSATRAVETQIDGFRVAGVKIVMTTHDLGQARRVGDEILFFHRGRLIEQSAAETFFAGPASDEARAFIDGELLW